MYAKCGYLDGARGVFGRMRRKNVISWTSMISAYAIHGEADQALMLFRQMKEPNWITFVAVLYACSHAGLVDEAQQIFSSMRSPSNVVIWGSLMAACRIHGEFELGEFAAKRLLELDPEHDGAYVFLSNVYAKADKSHKHADDIYGKLAEVVCKLKQVGYAPNTSVVLIDVDEDEKKDMVLLHSEKLALCYGLLRSNNGSPIRIIKNLRICEDCHNFMKLASKRRGHRRRRRPVATRFGGLKSSRWAVRNRDFRKMKLSSHGDFFYRFLVHQIEGGIEACYANFAIVDILDIGDEYCEIIGVGDGYCEIIGVVNISGGGGTCVIDNSGGDITVGCKYCGAKLTAVMDIVELWCWTLMVLVALRSFVNSPTGDEVEEK
ncbi:hypothetical protein T459_29180 [Capsicum annuum]|uniref:DYW domain-containing protein n=1 Tax=Capsicum annuum TaxID=4072 RepID=A0A2G2Y4T0_CAPAN|nr:hypothetical protein T459_29180 [Capsicum annuum]